VAEFLRLSNNFNELDGPLVVVVAVQVPPTMCPQLSDVVPDLDPLHSTSQPMGGRELLTATRLPRLPQPPSIPPRNPLRLRPTSVNNDRPPQPVISSLRMRIVHSHSLPLLDTAKAITAVHANENISVDEKSSRKSLPESPIMPPLSPVDTIDDGDSSTGSSSSLNNNGTSPPPAMSQRNHALHELLSSERAYASDLALIRDIHIPLALGE
jgi:hypothetical protein